MRPRILGHRGASGHALENTIAAFQLARELGADGVELDIHVTADLELVVHHDLFVPGAGPIARARLDQLRRAALPPDKLPLLAEALDALAGVEVWVELKALPPAADRRLFDVLAAAPTPERCAVHSFDHRIVARLGGSQPGLRRGVLSSSYPIDPVAPIRVAGASTLWQEWSLIDAPLVRAVHDAGAEIIAWTVNEADDARALAAMGVDGLCGNYPERLRVN